MVMESGVVFKKPTIVGKMGNGEGKGKFSG